MQRMAPNAIKAHSMPITSPAITAHKSNDIATPYMIPVAVRSRQSSWPAATAWEREPLPRQARPASPAVSSLPSGWAAIAGAAPRTVSARAPASLAPGAPRGSIPSAPARAALPACASLVRVQRAPWCRRVRPGDPPPAAEQAFHRQPRRRSLCSPTPPRPTGSAGAWPVCRRPRHCVPTHRLAQPRGPTGRELERVAERPQLAPAQPPAGLEEVVVQPLPAKSPPEAARPCVAHLSGRRSDFGSACPARRRSKPAPAAEVLLQDWDSRTPLRQPSFWCSASYRDRGRSGSRRSGHAKCRPGCRRRPRAAVRRRQAGAPTVLSFSR